MKQHMGDIQYFLFVSLTPVHLPPNLFRKILQLFEADVPGCVWAEEKESKVL